MYFEDDYFFIKGSSIKFFGPDWKEDDKDDKDDEDAAFDLEDFEATDWEIYEDLKGSLSDQITEVNVDGLTKIYYAYDPNHVKEKVGNAQRRLHKAFHDRTANREAESIDKIFKEEFGDRIC